jgi:DNA-binding response OmpR family regulator
MGKKVLIIDDEKLLVKSTCMALNFYGFEAQGVLDGEAGLRKIVEIMPDVVLLDIMMPGMDGWQVLERLKADSVVQKIPVIMFTAKEHSNGTVLAHAKGAADYIAKPFDPEEMVSVLNRYCNSPTSGSVA